MPTKMNEQPCLNRIVRYINREKTAIAANPSVEPDRDMLRYRSASPDRLPLRWRAKIERDRPTNYIKPNEEKQ